MARESMTREQGDALDRHLTSEPETCEEDVHSWRYLGGDHDGGDHYKCRRCGEEMES